MSLSVLKEMRAALDEAIKAMEENVALKAQIKTQEEKLSTIAQALTIALPATTNTPSTPTQQPLTNINSSC